MSSNFYAAPSYMSGGSFTIYSGSRRQRGGGFLGSMKRYMAPIGRTAFKGMKSLARNKVVRNLAKQAAQKGTEVLAGAAVDALQGRNLGEALRERGREVALKSLTGGPPQRSSSKRKLKQRKKRKLSVASTKLTSTKPKVKRRRKSKRKELF